MIDILRKLGLPEGFSLQAGGIDDVMVWVHILMFVLFAGWGAFFIYVLFRFRRSRNPRGNYVGMRSHFSSYAEIGIALFEVILLVAFSFPVWASRTEEFPDEDEAEVVRVVAQQFKWNIHYPGPDGVFGRTDVELMDDQTLNFIGLDKADEAATDDIVPDQGHLHLPVNKPVLIYLSTKDVIHSFFVPVMRVKQDAIPGMRIPLWFTPTRTGSWEIACAQLCGNSHYEMKGFIHVHTPAGYEATMRALSLVHQVDDYDLTREAEITLSQVIGALWDGDPIRAEELALKARSQAEVAMEEKGAEEESEWEDWEEWK